MTAIYKIFRPQEWDRLNRDGSTRGSRDDERDGFIHFSTYDQLSGTLHKHFAHEGELVLALCKAKDFGAELKWEPSRAGALFPHLYGLLRMDQIMQHWPLVPGTDGRYSLPPL